jgi:2-polyprenyl-6-methoxyphenol hydroxylase-like FAD-dependent oxidoreductase
LDFWGKDMTVLIAGGGIAGLTMGLTLHQIGVPFHIFESVKSPKPLGVGINLQPTAVRELMELGLEPMLNAIGIRTQDYGFYTKTGLEIWTEPRGLEAGYHWPQYSVHRGHLHMALLEVVRDRCGAASITTGAQVLGFENTDQGVRLRFETEEGQQTVDGSMLIAADGIHSSVRAQMYPDEGAPVWGGAVMWRGTTLAKPFLSGGSMILAGHDTHRFVAYPITETDPESGLTTLNWIAEKTVDPKAGFSKEDWNRQVSIDLFKDDFVDWDFDWLDVPAIIRGADTVYEYPMIDREPVDCWRDGATILSGDAAHATYPVGSSGASQAVLDARILGAAILEHGVGATAAQAFEDQVLVMANRVTMANRGNGGPDAIMQMAEDRCEGDFTRLDDVLPYAEREAHALAFKKLAGLTAEGINGRPSIIKMAE